MTGSGKTGLCVGLLEEAALDKVPTIMIDPKGDITNLLLQFPELRPEDFLDWINDDDARRKGRTVAEQAQATAELWRTGLADWGIGSDRIRLLQESADFTIFTPGSDAGVPINILGSLAAPDLEFTEHAEAIRERISGTVAALLGLTGSKADPNRSREAILLSNIFEYNWSRGQDLDLAQLIMSIQNPPVRQLGVFDVDTFYPEKDRFELAMAFNNLVASPSFQNWLQGEALDIDQLYYTSDGKPRHSIFYIAHLSDSERMFFVTLLLENVLTWVRRQPGTTSLRALLYFDEVFGFLPPTAEPPSKRPLLTLLKQARAFGLGCLLVTQNPVDLDYKGLTNTGTWFIGKLQAERDKARVLQGLKGAIAEAGGSGQEVDYDTLLSQLSSRVFLLHNVHEEQPVVFHTRWAMSYLRGPLTRPQVRKLMKDKAQDILAGSPATGQPQPARPSVEPAPPEPVAAAAPPATRPSLQRVTGVSTHPIERTGGSAAAEFRSRQ
jgi:DNA helicase HerA-like ATPase